MSEWRKVKLKEVLNHKKGSIKIDDDTEYKLCRVRLHRRGVLLRGNQFGHQIKTKKQQVCQTGDLIVAEMDAKFGGYGFIPDELTGAIVSSHYYLYELDKTKISQDYFQTLISTDYIQNQIEAKGSTNYSSIRAKEFLEYEIPLANQNLQAEISKRFLMFSNFNTNLNLENDNQKTYLTKLRQAILQEAIEGKLTADWRLKNPVCLGDPNTDAAALLATIKAEKQKLIAEGKIKKEKPLAPINSDDVPFALPDGWVWVKLGGICSKIGSGSTPNGSNYSSEGFPFFRSQNIYNTGLVFNDIKYISADVHKKMNGTMVLSGDLLLNITGGSLARCARVPDDFNEGNVSQHVCIIRPIKIDKKLLHLLMLSPFFQKFIFSSTTGAGREGLPKYNLEQFTIPLPPIAEQHAIVERVDSLLNHVNALEQQVAERKSHAEQLMHAVLREAFSA